MANYTLRIYDNSEAPGTDADFETLQALYDSIFVNWSAESGENVPRDPEQLAFGFSVFDNAEDRCINSTNVAEIGLGKADPRPPFTFSE